ncbi:Metallo-beta-lactamase superfamily protein [Chryseolinea serpens]|uniref:Metallo-beta-lactamase superfamily protein n=2 Tax=Chryseolinea serpens TaxID=947013 RepID=A0A1M5XT89_9BACT|nr:Metallo-beta-lactamase superfamily protein [Chryseolinea serpens]
MINIHHLNCGILSPPGVGSVACHCLLLEEDGHLALVDAGFGLRDIQSPLKRIGQDKIDFYNIRFDARHTAVHQIEDMGFVPAYVRDCIITHLDFDHIGGLDDFPYSTVHVAAEEYASFASGNPRYLHHQLGHRPKLELYEKGACKWFGMEARKLKLPFSTTVYLIPLFGHTKGHCGVAIQQNENWILHVGDAFYLEAELFSEAQKIAEVASKSADDDHQRKLSLKHLMDLLASNKHIKMLSYHEPSFFNLEAELSFKL